MKTLNLSKTQTLSWIMEKQGETGDDRCGGGFEDGSGETTTFVRHVMRPRVRSREVEGHEGDRI